MDLYAYLKRLGYAGKPRADRQTLDALMRAHVLSVPFENLDQQLRRPVTTDIRDAYEKVVGRHRGGWCFELNSLFGWALQEIGFEVESLAAFVEREPHDRDQDATHKCLRVTCGEPLLVDVGFGGSLIAPIPLMPGESLQVPYRIGIAREETDYLRFTEQAGNEVSWFAFVPEPVAADHFDAVSQHLQTDENSRFRRTLTAQRRFADHHAVLRGRVLRTIRADGAQDSVLPSAEALVSCLRETFGLDVPEIARIWPRIAARHEELFGG